MNVAIIPARGGSKGIPRKNVIPLAGRPLIAWSIEQARAARGVEGVYVSTDDEEIAQVARHHGASVVRRPQELASDTASSEDALLHAIDAIEATTRVTSVTFLQATSPLRESIDIESALDVFQREQADSLFSCTEVRDLFLWEPREDTYASVTYDFRARRRRQDIAPRYLENGSIYVFKPDLIRQTRNRLGCKIAIYEMPAWKSLQVDDWDGLEMCEYFMRTKLLKEAKQSGQPAV